MNDAMRRVHEQTMRSAFARPRMPSASSAPKRVEMSHDKYRETAGFCPCGRMMEERSTKRMRAYYCDCAKFARYIHRV